MLRLKYGNKWKKTKSADKRVVDYFFNIVRPLAKTVSTKGDLFYEFFDKSDGAIEAIANKCKVHSFNPLWIEELHDLAVNGKMYYLREKPGLLTHERNKDLNNMEYIPPTDGIAVAKLSQAYEGAPCFWVPDDDLTFTELYRLLDYESAKGPFGEAFLRLSCYQRCRCALRPTGFEYPARGKIATPPSASGCGGVGNLAAAATSRAVAAASPTAVDKTLIIEDPVTPVTERVTAGPAPVRRHQGRAFTSFV